MQHQTADDLSARSTAPYTARTRPQNTYVLSSIVLESRLRSSTLQVSNRGQRSYVTLTPTHTSTVYTAQLATTDNRAARSLYHATVVILLLTDGF